MFSVSSKHISSDEACWIGELPRISQPWLFPCKCRNKTHSDYHSAPFLPELPATYCWWCGQRGQLGSWRVCRPTHLTREGTKQLFMPGQRSTRCGSSTHPFQTETPLSGSGLQRARQDKKTTASGQLQLRRAQASHLSQTSTPPACCLPAVAIPRVS